MTDLAPTSALAGHVAAPSIETHDLSVKQFDGMGCLVIKARRDGEEVVASIASLLGVAPPGPGQASSGDRGRLLSIGPREWVAIVPDVAIERLSIAIGLAVTPLGAIVVDQSDAAFMVNVVGAGSRALLAKGCGLEVERLSPGTSTRTRFAQIPVVVSLDQEGVTQLIVGRAYAIYLWSWLSRAIFSCTAPSE